HAAVLPARSRRKRPSALRPTRRPAPRALPSASPAHTGHRTDQTGRVAPSSCSSAFCSLLLARRGYERADPFVRLDTRLRLHTAAHVDDIGREEPDRARDIVGGTATSHD